MILCSFTSSKPMQKGLLTSFTLRFICSHFNLLTSNFSFQPCSSEHVSAANIPIKLEILDILI